MSKVLSFEEQYRELLYDAMLSGVRRKDRTKVGSRSLFAKSLTFNYVDGTLPIITGRKMFSYIWDAEYNWFLNGETNIQSLKDAGVKIWDAWADENGDLGPVYGYQMRDWNGSGIDQMAKVIESITLDRDSRRHIINLWNVEQIDQMALPPCYNYFQFFVENGTLNMYVNMRSADLFLGVPYDMMLFTRILFYVATKTMNVPGKLHLNMVDAHVYENQIAVVEEYLKTPFRGELSYKYSQQLDVLNPESHNKDLKNITAPVAV